MKSDELRKRLNENRTMVPVSIRMPEDVIEDLKRIAPQLGWAKEEWFLCRPNVREK